MSAKKVFGTAIFVITVMLLLSLGVFFNPSDPIGAFEHQFTVYDADINLEEEEAVFTVSRNFSNTAASINYRTVSLTAFEGTHLLLNMVFWSSRRANMKRKLLYR